MYELASNRRWSGTLAALLLLAVACAAPADQSTPGPTEASPSAPTTAGATAAPPTTPTAAPQTAGPTADPSVEPTSGSTSAPTRTAPPLDVWVGPERVGTRSYDALSLIIDGDGLAHAAAELNDGIFYLTNASGSWTRERLTTPPEGGSDREPSIALDPVDGYLAIAFTRYGRYDCFELGCFPADSMGIYVIHNLPGEWSELIEAVSGSAVRPDLRIGGGEHLAYELIGTDDSWVHHATAGQPGPTWIDTRLGVGSSPSLQLGSDGLPRIAYVDDGVQYATTVSPDGPFSIEQVPGIDGSPDLLLDSADVPHLVYSSFDDPTAILHSERAGESWTAPDLIVADRFASQSAIDGNGTFHVIYDAYDSADEDDDGLWYATNRQGSYALHQIDRSIRAFVDGPGAASALAVDRFNRPHFLYVVIYPDDRVGLYYAIGPGN